MALWQKGASIVSHRLPRVIGPQAHTFIDYSVAALFCAAGVLFWSRNKRAAVSSLLCGGGVLLNTLFTDYPGGVVPAMSFETHGKLDSGLAGMTAAIPGLMGFGSEPPARFFEAAAVAETIALGLTQYGPSEESAAEEWAEKPAA